jgi:hypothetical protein
MRKIATACAAIISISLLVPTFASAASPSAGAACTKAGLTSSTSTKKFTCIKSGNKLVWDKGVALAKPATSDPTKTTLKNKIPITLPVSQNGTITFANAAENYAQIPKVAWQRVQDVIAANPEVSIPTTIHIGPNTKADVSVIKSSLNKLFKLFSGFNLFDSYFGIVYNAKDLAWAQTDAGKLFETQGIKGYLTKSDAYKQQSSAGCEMKGTTAVSCSGGMALTFKDGGSNAGGSFYGVENTYTENGKSRDFWTEAEKFSGPMTQVTHEGTHNFQFSQFFITPFKPGQNTGSDISHAFTPWWFSEGQANGIGIPAFVDNYESYLNVRSQNANRKPDSRAKVPAFTADAMKSFLKTYQVTGPENSNWSLAYSVGYSAVEALIAIGGPQSTMALYALGGNGENWETAFKNVYGISWDEGATVLGKVLAAQYTADPFSKN